MAPLTPRPSAQVIPFPNATPPRPVRRGRYPKNVVPPWRLRLARLARLERRDAGEAALQARLDELQRRIHAGRLVYKEARYTNEQTGLQEIKPYCHLTQKGLANLARVIGRPPPLR